MDWRVRMCTVLSVLVPILLVGCAGSTTSSANPRSPSLVSIAVTPANKSVSVGGTLQFKATGTFADNSTQDLTNSGIWASSNTSVVTINSNGLATGVTVGDPGLNCGDASEFVGACRPDGAVQGDGDVLRQHHAGPDELGDLGFVQPNRSDNQLGGPRQGRNGWAVNHDLRHPGQPLRLDESGRRLRVGFCRRFHLPQ